MSFIRDMCVLSCLALFAVFVTVILPDVCGCNRPLPKPESVTLVRVDGGFMTCTTFIQVDGGP